METSIDLLGRVAVVTGGASGIGRACAILLAQHGAQVFAADFDPLPENDSVFTPLNIAQRRCDVRRESELEALFDEASAAGSVRILVNSAGVGMVKQIEQVTEDDWDRCLETNLKGAFFACKHAIGHMRAAGGGAIVNIASNAGLLPRAHDPVYSISKAALIALTKSLALCHARDRVRINALCPGPVENTRMMEGELDMARDRDEAIRELINASPLAAAYDRMTSPEEIAQAALYLVSDASLMVTGTPIGIDGGKSLGVPPQ